MRPAVTFGTPGVEYLMNDSSFAPDNIMTLWSLTNPLSTTPTLTAVNVTVGTRNFPPNANQQGGSTPDAAEEPNCADPCLIGVGGSRIRNVVYRNWSVWTAHSAADSTGNFDNARYVRINVSGPTVQEDVSIGAPNCWYYYPAIITDANSNMAMVFNRSCTTEFAGIRYITRLNGGALQPSAPLKAGEANYVKTFGSARNRWGDYSGAAVDPADDSLWMFAEYAASPADTWSTWFGQVQFNTTPVADNQTVNATGDTPVAITLTGSDADSGDTLSFIITSLPGSGDLSEGSTSIITGNHVLTGDTVTYTPDPGVTGTDTFKFKVNDTKADSNIATVTINVTDTPQSSPFTVSKTGDSNDGFCGVVDCSLREATVAANSGDTIVVPAGTYTLTLGTQLTLTGDLTLTGAGSGDTIIQAATSSAVATSRVFLITGDGNVDIHDVTIRHGNAGNGNGGGILNSGSLTLSNSIVSRNTTANTPLTKGGGIFNAKGATADVASSAITGNSVGDNGGGISNRGALTLTDSTVSGNTISLTGAGGGVANASGTATISGSTISGNGGRSVDGGGIDNHINGSITISNSTIAANQAIQGDGGGLRNTNGSVITLTNVTIANNVSGTGRSGELINAGTIQLSNTILYNANNCFGASGNPVPVSKGHNLSSDNSCSLNATGDLNNTDPNLGPLQDNGGPTFTHALQPGSPAIDTGDPPHRAVAATPARLPTSAE